MALASNTKEQLAKRLKADIELRDASLTVVSEVAASGDPVLTIKSGATVVGLCQISRRSFSGFNVVAELSSSAAEGLPEHVAYLLQLNTNTQLLTAKLAVVVKQLGTSSVKLGFKAAPVIADMVDDTYVSEEIPNDSRAGASGQ